MSELAAKTTSTPGTEAIAAASAGPTGASIIATITTLSLKVVR